MEAVVSKKTKRFNFRASLCMPYAVFMILFVVFPLFVILAYAFTDENWAFTFKNWGDIFSTATTWKTIGTTFIISACSTLGCLLIAYPIAYLLANSKYNKNKILVYIFLLPMWINFVIRTIGLKDLLNNISSLFGAGDLTSSNPYVAIVIGMIYDYLPFAILPLYNQMLKLDKSQIEAAADLGANPVQVFVKSIIPQTIPGIISACTMTFMPTMSSYVIANKMSEGNKQIIGSMIEDYFLKRTTELSNHIGSVVSLVMLLIVGVSLVAEKALSKDPNTKKGEVY